MRYLQFPCILFFAAVIGCNANEGRGNNGHGGPGGDDAGVGSGGDDGGGGLDDGGIFQQPDGMTVVQDPATCAEAAANKSYIGCDYWPTVVANAVWNIFDFAVVVSNPGQNPAMVTVTGPNSTNQMVTVMPGQLEKIYLPWVTALKGPDADAMGASMPITNSVFSAAGAYHLVSSVPVLVYQFSALEYAPKGGAPGKDWSKCPGTGNGTLAPACFSYSNDASLLLPSTAMTGNYRVLGEHGVDGPGLPPIIPQGPGIRGYIAITGTQDNTTVKVQLSSTGSIVKDSGGTKITDVAAGATTTYMINSGDVLELFGADKTASDLSGSLVQADKPVQVIAGSPCIANPQAACDHIEESVMPAETLGKHYVVTMPTGPHDTAVGTTVRIVGNVDGTNLTYSPAVSGAPPTINAGQVYEFDASADFVVQGDHEFIVGMVMKSGSVVDPGATTDAKGDPSLSSAIAAEQYRLKYVFLAPDDYDLNYADVVAQMGASLMLDGAPVTVTPSQVGTTGYGVYRIKLSNTNGGTHTLVSDQPAGLQVLGYGSYTSYQYPGGLDLLSIAPPPPPIS